MFSPDQRDTLRDALIDLALEDERITGAAITGSNSLGIQDDLSDIDLAFGIGESFDVADVIIEWTSRMYDNFGAVHHTDLVSGGVTYRVFLLANTLQVDIAFAPERLFGATAPTFRLVFGSAQELPHTSGPDPEDLIGMGWLYALHARSSIVRGRRWQAEYMISGLRDQVMALACVRFGVSPNHGRGFDRLPEPLLSTFEAGLVRSLDDSELSRALRALGTSLLHEIAERDVDLATRLSGPITELTSLPTP